jgi:hypothetical protein
MSSAPSNSVRPHLGTDIAGVLSEAWRVVRGARPLWWLGAISALQAVIYSAVVMLMVLPSVALPQLIAPLEQASHSTRPDTAALSALSGTLLAGSEAVVRYLPAVVTGIVLLMCCWVASGVFDVAAQAGCISQVVRVAEGGRASVRAGMRDGFAVWWQSIGLLAVAALPALALMLALAVSTLLTYTLPLSRGELPNTGLALTSQVAITPLQGIVSIVSIVLGVVVQMSMRSVVLEGMPWRPALRSGWATSRAHMADVALVYVFVAAAGIPVGLVSVIVIGVIALVVGGLVAAVAVLLSGSTMTGAVWGIVIGSICAAPAWLAIQALFIAWVSAVWTVLWHRLRVRPGAGDDVGVVHVGGTLPEMGASVSRQL